MIHSCWFQVIICICSCYLTAGTSLRWQAPSARRGDFNGTCRAVYNRGIQKTAFLDDIPFLFARLGIEANIGPRAISQYGSVPKTQHHRVSVELCDPDGIYCAEILGMENEFILTKNLERRILPIRKANMNDKIAEGPHAVFKNEDLRTRGEDFYWAAASWRLEHNLADIRDLSSACQLSVQEVFGIRGKLLCKVTIIPSDILKLNVQISWKKYITASHWSKNSLEKKVRTRRVWGNITKIHV